MAKHTDKMLGMLMAAFPRQEFPAESQELYSRMLADLNQTLLEAAVSKCITENTFLPAIAEIRQAATDIQLQAAGHKTAAEAWGEVQDGMRPRYCAVMHSIEGDGDQLAHYRECDDCERDYLNNPPVFSPAVQQTVDYFGWEALCNSDNQVADRAHFMRMYQQVADRQVGEVHQYPAITALVEQMEGPHAKQLTE